MRREVVGLSACLITFTGMYFLGQWFRMAGDGGELLPNLCGFVALTIVGGFLWRLNQRNKGCMVFGHVGVALGIAAGIVADVFWPIAAGHGSNMGPIAIIAWWLVAFVGGLVGVAVAELLRYRSERQVLKK